MSRCCLLLAVAVASPALSPAARAEAPGPTAQGFVEALRSGESGIKARYRYEHQDNSAISRRANAHSVVVRFEHRSAWWRNLRLGLQLDWVNHLGAERFDDTRNGNTSYPRVPDPNGLDLNNLYLDWKPRPDTLLRTGRQCIDFEVANCHRFAWRQNHRTVDALRIETTAVPDTEVSATRIQRVQEPVGPDNGLPDDSLEADVYLFDAHYTGWQGHRIGFVSRWVDLIDAPANSSNTHGLTFAGKQPADSGHWLYRARWLRQDDGGRNPASYRAENRFLELGRAYQAAEFRVGWEVLEGHPTRAGHAYTRPLSARHALNGWADRFTATPATGVRDRYVQYVQGFGADTDLTLRWHDFDSQATSRDFGEEVNVRVSHKLGEHYKLELIAADYRARDTATDGLAEDVTKYWVQLLASF